MLRNVPVFLVALFAILEVPAIPAQTTAEKNPKREVTSPALRVDPLLIAEAREVWALIGSANNPVWPGWDASSTPLLVYLPREQDVLINHPHPPEGFRPYSGPVHFPGWQILVKDGPTIIGIDGQNTSKEVNGVPTLVVADSLSNLRQNVFGVVADPRPAQDKFEALNSSSLATDPYAQLALVVHEAFHVYQDKMAPDKGANEMLLLYYPVLSVENNVGFALEGSALAEALGVTDARDIRQAAVRWLAVRKHRRSLLPAKAAEYEDGVEYKEGLAKYAEYRLFQVLEGRKPGPALTWARGFGGYDDLAPQRHQLTERLLQNMSGTVNVNNDPYGTAPLRMRLYYSGMAMGVLLDRLLPGWQKRIFAADASLTSLLEEAIRVSPEALSEALKQETSAPGYAGLVKQKTRLAADGKARIEAAVKEIEAGPGLSLIVDYSQLADSKLRMGFTPFGITVVDADRTIFTQVPIKVIFGKSGELTQTVPAPLLRDTGRKFVQFRLPHSATRGELQKKLDAILTRGNAATDLTLEVPGAILKAAKAEVHWSGDNLTVALLESDPTRR